MVSGEIALEIVQGALRFFYVGGSQNHQALLRFRARREVRVLDVDPSLGQTIGDVRQDPWFVIALNHQNVILEREHTAFTEDHEGLGGITHDHADDGVIDRVGSGEGVDVNLGGGQLRANTRERAGAVPKKDSELCGGLDRHLRVHERKNARVVER